MLSSAGELYGSPKMLCMQCSSASRWTWWAGSQVVTDMVKNLVVNKQGLVFPIGWARKPLECLCWLNNVIHQVGHGYKV